MTAPVPNPLQHLMRLRCLPRHSSSLQMRPNPLSKPIGIMNSLQLCSSAPAACTEYTPPPAQLSVFAISLWKPDTKLKLKSCLAHALRALPDPRYVLR